MIFSGNNNSILSNALYENFHGIVLSPGITGNVIEYNVVNRNSGSGIALSATSSVVKNNTARGNCTADLADAHPGCSMNIWTSNSFRTDAVLGITDGGPWTGCIQ